MLGTGIGLERFFLKMIYIMFEKQIIPKLESRCMENIYIIKYLTWNVLE